MTFRKEEHTGRKIAVGSIIAGVAGYVTGILTAPKTGKQTREELADQAGAVKNSAENELKYLDIELREMIKSTKVKTIALSSSARAEFNESLAKAKDAQNKAAQVLKAVKRGEAADPELNKAVKQAKQAAKNLGKYLKT